MIRPRPPVRRQTYLLVYALIALFMVLSHGPLLYTPFYWDETGQFIPAALDLFHTGALIPHSTLPNVHPPGVMAYLAFFWHIFGFSIAGTRVAMLLLAAFGVLCTFLLGLEHSREAPGTPGFVVLVMISISPLFFAQAMLAQLDMPARHAHVQGIVDADERGAANGVTNVMRSLGAAAGPAVLLMSSALDGSKVLGLLEPAGHIAGTSHGHGHGDGDGQLPTLAVGAAAAGSDAEAGVVEVPCPPRHARAAASGALVRLALPCAQSQRCRRL
jgi:hypothetical protein